MAREGTTEEEKKRFGHKFVALGGRGTWQEEVPFAAEKCGWEWTSERFDGSERE
jgi:hypothetical protein